MPRRASPASQRMRADKLENVFHASTEILERDGFDGFNTNAVIKRSGVSTGWFYSRFKDKHALMAALMDDERAKLDGALSENGLRPMYGQSELKLFIHRMVEHQLDQPKLRRLLDFVDHRAQQLETRSLRGAAIDRLREILCMPDLRRNDPRTAHDVLAIISGFIWSAADMGEWPSPNLKDRIAYPVFVSLRIGYLTPHPWSLDLEKSPHPKFGPDHPPKVPKPTRRRNSTKN